jgi:signal transduction histidine kinase/DNA-binding NarL/FixJ family response regulator
MTRQPGSRFYKTVVIVWLTLSIGSVVLAVASWMELSSEMANGRRMNAIREDLDDVIKLCLDAETAARGYIITGNTNFLQPLRLAVPSVGVRFDDLVTQSGNDSEFLKSVTDLRGQVDLVFDWERRVVEARDRSFGRAADLMNTGEGKRLMDRIREQVSSLYGQHTQQLFAIRNRIQTQLYRANLTSLTAGTIGFGAGLFAFWLTQVALRQQRRERELVEGKREAERSSKEKTAFLANMSHEIRTPMNAIIGFSELLQGDLADPKHERYLRSIRSSADSLLRLINDILDMSKIEAGVLDLRPEPTDPREICNFIRTLFTEPTTRKNIRLNCHIAEDLPRAILLDGIRLRQIVVNLVGNAVKFTDHGVIDVHVLWEKQAGSSHITLVLEVQDTGLGIPQDKLDAIFKPFVQAGAHREKEKQGTGLGLSIVKRLTEIMGGTVTVASVMGQGSAFHLRFPNIPISARLPSSEKLLDAAPVDFNILTAAQILVVDDNETNCQLIAGMFECSHHKLVFAYSGEEAVDKLKNVKPDAILLDVRMPGMGGAAALTKIRTMPGLELTPVIAVTASSLMEEEHPLREQFSGYLRKPFSKSELFKELAEFLPQRAPDPQADGAAPSVNGASSVAVNHQPVPRELLAQLQQLLLSPWPTLRDSVAVNESKMFAQGLEGLGQRWQCAPLTAYARKLLADTENYAVMDLEQHLGEFSELVAELGKNIRE